jgi:hypothetical protein
MRTLPYTHVISSEQFHLLDRRSAIADGEAEIRLTTPAREDEVLVIGRQLTIDLPEFSWDIEVNLLGLYRVTIRFKGGSIDVNPV